MKKYKLHVESTLSNLLQSSVSFWRTDSYDVFFEGSQLDPLKIKTAFPDMCTTDENEANLSEHITTTVEQYFTLNLWEKIWWRLTKPINHYMILNDILTLNKMKEALAEDSVSKSIVIYNQSSLRLHLDFWDGLMTSWRYLLDNFVLTKSTRYKENLIRDSLIYMKEPFNGTELICKINQYVELMDKQFNGLAPYYIYTKENAIKILQNEYNVCKKILDKLSLANNQRIGIDVDQSVREVTKVKEQVEYRLNTLSMECSSLKEMVNELLAQDYLTPGERDRLNASKELIRKKEQQAASNACSDKMSKKIQKMDGELKQSFKQIEENISRLDQSMKEFSQDLKRQDDDRQAKFAEFEGEVGQFFSLQAHADNGLLMEQTEEEDADEQTSYFDSRMP